MFYNILGAETADIDYVCLLMYLVHMIELKDVTSQNTVKLASHWFTLCFHTLQGVFLTSKMRTCRDNIFLFFHLVFLTLHSMQCSTPYLHTVWSILLVAFSVTVSTLDWGQ